jgi:hypothetical protein
MPLSVIAVAALAMAIIWHLANREEPEVVGDPIVAAEEANADEEAGDDSPDPSGEPGTTGDSEEAGTAPAGEEVAADVVPTAAATDPPQERD